MGTQHCQLEKRFGDIAIEKGFVSPEQLVEALKIQAMDDIEKGKHRLIGRIILEQGIVTLDQIDAVLDVLGKGMPLLHEFESS